MEDEGFKSYIGSRGLYLGLFISCILLHYGVWIREEIDGGSQTNTHVHANQAARGKLTYPGAGRCPVIQHSVKFMYLN